MDANEENTIWCYYSIIYWDEKRQTNIVSFHTRWTGFADDQGRIELREPRLFEYNSLRDYHTKFEAIPFKFVSNSLELYEFLLLGGAAAIEKSVAEAEIPHYLAPEAVVSTGFGSFDSLNTTVQAATQRAPSKKMRMKILERDKFRCIVCGQRPSDDPNVVLNVHHVRPWENLGATAPSNLVTLCHTCHLGLDPHYNRNLANLIDDPRDLQKSLQTPPKLDF